MTSTSCASSQLSNVRVRSWLLSSPDNKPHGRVSFLPLRRRDGFRPQATLMAAAAGPSSSSSPKAPIYEPLIHSLPPMADENPEDYEQERRDPITEENVEDWLKDSVTEIVKNIGEAPFLVQIFSKGDRNNGGGGGVRVELEATAPDAWTHIQKRWGRERSQPPPDGIILVNELKEELLQEEESVDGYSDSGTMAGSSKVWGLLVQGRGMECVACYILNTCRVLSPAGCCTHFYLARAQCFGDPLELQMRNAWLQPKRR